jgi:hypothetical protein
MTLLRWAGYRGTASLAGRRVDLEQAPRLSQGTVWEIDYRPGIGVREIQMRSTEPVRDMDQFEVEDAERYLRLVTAAAVRRE